MLLKVACRMYDLDEADFEAFVRTHYRNYDDYNFRVNGFEIVDEKLTNIVARYLGNDPNEVIRIKKEIEEQEALNKAERDRKAAQILITSGFSFDGYRVVKYSGYISGDDVARISNYDRLFEEDMIGQELCDSLVKIRRRALQELKEAAVDLGCNAVIGVDYDYITLEPQTNSIITGRTVALPLVICVTANGNAVIIEKTSE